MTIRQDAWSDRDDRLLAQTVLTHIREGSTQLKAFDETGDMLDRTSAACGFRWNAIVRQSYEDEVKEAKRERKRRMRHSAQQAIHYVNPAAPISSTTLTLNETINYLEKLSKQIKAEGDVEQRERDVSILQEENARLKEEISKVTKEHEMMRRDYETIVSMMNRARELAVTEEHASSPYTFKMEKNGNLEKMNGAG